MKGTSAYRKRFWALNAACQHPMASHSVSPRLISSHLISSHLTSPHLTSSHLISSHLISSHLISLHPHLILLKHMPKQLIATTTMRFASPTLPNTKEQRQRNNVQESTKWPMRDRSDHGPSMLRASPSAELQLPQSERPFVWKNLGFPAPTFFHKTHFPARPPSKT